MKTRQFTTLLSCCLLPGLLGATSVNYQIRENNNYRITVLDLTIPTFLPQLSNWSSLSQFINLKQWTRCSTLLTQGNACSSISFEQTSAGAEYFVHTWDPYEQQEWLTALLLFPTDLQTIGSFPDSKGLFTLTVTDPPATAPEPASWGLLTLASALLLFYCLRRQRVTPLPSRQ